MVEAESEVVLLPSFVFVSMLRILVMHAMVPLCGGWCYQIGCFFPLNITACLQCVLAGFSPRGLDGKLALSWTKLNCERAPFTNTRMNAFTITFIRQNTVRSVHVRPKYEQVHERSFTERVQAQHWSRLLNS